MLTRICRSACTRRSFGLQRMCSSTPSVRGAEIDQEMSKPISPPQLPPSSTPSTLSASRADLMSKSYVDLKKIGKTFGLPATLPRAELVASILAFVQESGATDQCPLEESEGLQEASVHPSRGRPRILEPPPIDMPTTNFTLNDAEALLVDLHEGGRPTSAAAYALSILHSAHLQSQQNFVRLTGDGKGYGTKTDYATQKANSGTGVDGNGSDKGKQRKSSEAPVMEVVPLQRADTTGRIVYNIIGALDGNFTHLLHIFSEFLCGYPSETNRFVFLGNFISSPEAGNDEDNVRMLVGLAAMQLAVPQSITLLAGANEFAWRSVDRDNPEKKKTFDMVRLTKPLRYLPLAAVLDETVILSSKVMGEMISQLKVDDINSDLRREVMPINGEYNRMGQIIANFLSPKPGENGNVDKRRQTRRFALNNPGITVNITSGDTDELPAYWSITNRLLELRSASAKDEDLAIAKVIDAKTKHIEIFTFKALGNY